MKYATPEPFEFGSAPNIIGGYIIDPGIDVFQDC